MNSQKPTIVLIDEHVSFSELLAQRLEEVLSADVVGICDSWETFLQNEMGVDPDLILTEIKFGQRWVTDILTTSHLRVEPRRIAILSSCYTDIHLQRLIDLGVQGCLQKESPIDELTDGIRTMLNQERFFSAAINRRLQLNPKTNQLQLRDPSSVAQLTVRQLEVLRCIGSGLSAKDAADEMSLTPKSVESYTYRLMKVLDAHDRVQLAHIAIREGLIQ